MKKIVSLVIFTAALFWTWNVIHSSAAIGFETHSGIQEKLATLITQTVLTKKPTSKNFKITRLWTESISENKVRAVFAYSFSDSMEADSTEQTVEGEAILFREPQDDSGQDRWTLQSVRTTNDIVTFSEGMVVTPDSAEQPAQVEPTPTPAPTSTPAAEAAH